MEACDITVAQPAALDPKLSGYSLTLRVHDGFHTSDEVDITVSLPPVIRVCHKGVEEAVDKMGLNGHLAHGDAIGASAAF